MEEEVVFIRAYGVSGIQFDGARVMCEGQVDVVLSVMDFVFVRRTGGIGVIIIIRNTGRIREII